MRIVATERYRVLTYVLPYVSIPTYIYLYLYHLHRELSSRFSLRDVRQNRRLINDIGLEREARLDKEDVGERDGRTAEGTNRLARPASKSSIRRTRARATRRGDRVFEGWTMRCSTGKMRNRYTRKDFS